MERYKYRAINAKGRPSKGVMKAASEVDLDKQLQEIGLDLIDCSKLEQKGGLLSGLPKIGFKQKVKIVDLIQFYQHLNQMQGAGVPLLSALADLRDSADNNTLRDILAELHRSVTEGSSLSESMKRHEGIFSNLEISFVAAAEETGDLTNAYKELIKFLKWKDDMQRTVKKATRYPIILLVVVIVTIAVMMGFVVPQVVGFLENTDQELPIYTVALMATSDFFVTYWWAVLLGPIFAFFAFKSFRKMSYGFAYQTDTLMLRLPVMGSVVRKISLARFSQTFGSMFSSGISVLQSLRTARDTVDNKVIGEALDRVIQDVQEGSALSEAFTGEFPTMIIRMVKVGEESGNLSSVMDQIAEFYAKDVDDAVSGMLTLIEPFLTVLLGGMILWIAVAVFGPVYNSFSELDI